MLNVLSLTRRTNDPMSVQAAEHPALAVHAAPGPGVIHPAWVRVTHWINALAMLMMIGSGWQIYDASPLFGFTFPHQIALGNWLAGALLWHFAAMWLLVINGIVYVTLGIVSGRFRRKLFPVYPRDVLHDLFVALRGHLSHDDLSMYNGVEKIFFFFFLLSVRSTDRRRDRSVPFVDLETGAGSSVDQFFRRLQHRALFAFRRDDRDRSVPCRACAARRAGAEDAARHDFRTLNERREIDVRPKQNQARRG